MSPNLKGAIAGGVIFIAVNLLLFFFLYGWFSFGYLPFVGPFLGIVFGVFIAWCVKFANTPKKENE